MNTPARFIRAKDAPAYLGMNRNKFNAEIKPKLTVIHLGTQSRAYDRIDLDAIADDIKRRNGRPSKETEGTNVWQQKEVQVSRSARASGTSISKSKGMDDFAKALAAATSKGQTVISRSA